jgi:hypothetical protein
MVEQIQHTSLFAKRRTYSPCELRKGIGGREELIGSLPVALAKSRIPFRCLVTLWASPMAERHTTIHTARSLLTAFTRV